MGPLTFLYVQQAAGLLFKLSWEYLLDRVRYICSVAAALIRWRRESHLPSDHLPPQVTFLISFCALTVKLHCGWRDPVLFTRVDRAEASGETLHWLSVRKRFKYPSAFRLQLDRHHRK